MNSNNFDLRRTACIFLLASLAASGTFAQSSGASWYELMNTPAVSGYEQELASKIRAQLKDFSPKTDNLGNVIVTLGSGAPHRLIVTPMDEPGYVVSAITSDGYLRVQRLPQAAPNAAPATMAQRDVASGIFIFAPGPRQ